MRRETALEALLEPAVSRLGYELVGVEYHGGRRALLRVYIDREGGVSVEDCQRVSRQVSGLLDVEDPIPGPYTLEVSSPGLDRPLFREADFRRFAGRVVRIRTDVPLEGRRNFRGVLRGLRGGEVLVEVDGIELALPVERIEQARLVPEL